MREESLCSYSGFIERIIFRRNDWLVAIFLEDEGWSLKVTGNFYRISGGERLLIWGSWNSHPRYGEQFVVERYERPLPTTTEALKCYLGSGLVKGVGEALAQRIVDHFGEDTMETVRRQPEKLTAVKGISPRKAEEIGNAVQETMVFQQIVSYLLPYGVTSRMAIRIYRCLGSSALEKIKENPYVLTEVKLIGFIRADAIARRMNIPAASSHRIQAALNYILLETADSQGHCYLSFSELVSYALKLLNSEEISLRDVEGEIENAVQKGSFILEGEKVYHKTFYRWEEEAAAKVSGILKGRASSPPPEMIEKAILLYQQKSNLQLASAQVEVLREIWKNNLLLLTGGPGTGKTQTIKALIDVFQQIYSCQGQKVRLELAAPTGRASRRLSELTGRPARTIHRLLGLTPEGGQPEEIKADLLVIDEFSMVDLPLFHKLLEALRQPTRVLFVGDFDQLPSVGPGQVLRDLIAAGLPTVHLTEIFRQAEQSPIVVNAHRINHGETRLTFGPEFFFQQAEDPSQIAAAIRKAAQKYLKKHGNLEEIQVLSPMKKGLIGTMALNKMLQETFNPPHPQKNEISSGFFLSFRVGDKVIQNSNNYEKQVFNGDIGKIAAVENGKNGVKLTVNFPDSEPVNYAAEELEELSLAHAITVHKSQGSEYPVVILPVSTQHYIMLARNLIYTAITRARQKVILVGTRKALAIAVRNNQISQRCTFLKERIREHLS